MSRIETTDRRDQLVRCAEAVAVLAENRSIVAQHVTKLELVLQQAEFFATEAA